jgi:hypothetical protein
MQGAQGQLTSSKDGEMQHEQGITFPSKIFSFENSKYTPA